MQDDQLSAEIEVLRKWKHAVDNASWAIAIGGPQPVFEMVNPAFGRMYGYTPEEMRGMPIASIFTTAHQASVPELIERIRREGAASFEAVHSRRDGTEFPAAVEVMAVLGSDGQVLYWAVQVADVTQRVEAARALASSEQQMRLLTDAAAVFLAYVDRERRFRFNNRIYEEVFGRSVAEIKGSHIWEILGSENYEQIRQHVDAALAGRRSSFEITLSVPGPEDPTVAVKYVPDVAEDGTVCGFVVAASDITQWKRIESHLHETQRLEALGRLAGGIAHDFNNLLTVIQSHADFLRDELASGDPRIDDVDMITEAARRAARLTQQLLSFGRRRFQRLEVLDLNIAIEDASKMLRRILGDNIELRMNFGAKRAIRIDRSHLEQVLMNLLINARDAMRGGGTLFIETSDTMLDRQHEGEGDDLAVDGEYVMLVVTDTGTGMDEATRRRVFEPFFTTKGTEGGTGLGLATVYGIVRQSGGYISVSSDRERGTTFKVYLPPAGQAPTGAARRPEARAEVEQISATILVVEDDPAVRKAAVRILCRAGFNVRGASGGREGLDLARRLGTPIDLLLTDIRMPGMNGCQLVDRLTEIQPSLRVLYMSGYGDDAIVPNGVLGDGVAFQHKPFTADSLLLAVKRTLREED